MFRTLGTSGTCASFTHEKMSGDSRTPGGWDGLLFLNQFGGYVPQDSGCKFLYEHTEAMVTRCTYINRLLVLNFTEATATFVSYQLRVLTEASAPFLPSTNRLPPRP
jgi:hypothetical protein